MLCWDIDMIDSRDLDLDLSRLGRTWLQVWNKVATWEKLTLLLSMVSGTCRRSVVRGFVTPAHISRPDESLFDIGQFCIARTIPQLVLSVLMTWDLLTSEIAFLNGEVESFIQFCTSKFSTFSSYVYLVDEFHNKYINIYQKFNWFGYSNNADSNITIFRYFAST